MVPQTERLLPRATILVVSGSPAFEKIASQLLTADGFAAACAFEWEAARLSVTRTQPRVVLFDGTSTAAFVHLVAAEAAARGIPLVLAHHESELHDALAAARTRMPHVAGIALPLSADALRAVVATVLAPAAGAAPAHAAPRGGSPTAGEAGAIRRRDSLPSTLREIEVGDLTGIGVIVVSRGWWDELHLGEQTALRVRCDRLGIALRADDRLSRHFVELGGCPVTPPLSSERDV